MVDIGARVQNPTIVINGTQLRDALFERLVDLRIDNELQLPASFSLRFRDPTFDILDSKAFTLGAGVSIAFPTSDGSALVVLAGEITALAVDQGAGDRHELVVSGLDAAHRLAHGNLPATYLNMALPDVLSQVASRHG